MVYGSLGQVGPAGSPGSVGIFGLGAWVKIISYGFLHTIYCTGVTPSLLKDTGDMTGNKLRMTVIPSPQVCMLPLTVPSYFARVDMKYFYHKKL